MGDQQSMTEERNDRRSIHKPFDLQRSASLREIGKIVIIEKLRTATIFPSPTGNSLVAETILAR
jgi:hypothetical protein